MIYLQLFSQTYLRTVPIPNRTRPKHTQLDFTSTLVWSSMGTVEYGSCSETN